MKRLTRTLLSALLSLLIACCGSNTIVVRGTSGPRGESGLNGHLSLLAVIPVTIGCSNGGLTVLMGVDANDNLVLDTLEVQQSNEICNGQNGSNGQNGLDAPPTPFSPTGLVEPCGDAPGVFDEVFIRLANGSIVASFSDNISGYNTRFSLLTPGTYQTTDGDNCIFSLDNNGNIYNENHHY